MNIPPIHFPGEGTFPAWVTLAIGAIGFAGMAMFFIALFVLAGA